MEFGIDYNAYPAESRRPMGAAISVVAQDFSGNLAVERSARRHASDVN
ncbi:MAG: hypothetical protein IPO95_14365 [Rhodanobacteraceae bacterium]|nr:hypothetical protein [Rhodanobacteraceae bacterium]